MRVLFVSAQLYFPQLYGGVQTSTDQLCRAMIARGHKVALLMALMPGGLFGLKARIHMQINKRLAGCKVSKDTRFGYPVWRTWFPAEAVEYVCKKEKPDLIVVMSSGTVMPVALAAQRTNIPILVQLHDIAFGENYGDNLKQLGDVPYVANSHFTAEKYRQDYGIQSSVIYPFTSTDLYRTRTTKENVTFINPVPQKGLEIALKTARHCRDIPFSFVEGWTLSKEQRHDLRTRLADLPNVTLLPSRGDMDVIYGRSKILLVPSVFSETFGRVVTEAQASGIPVIASRRGGLPETVGAGGILVDPNGPIDDWVRAVRKLWQDEAHYAALSAAALAHSQRAEMNFAYQITVWEQAILAALPAIVREDHERAQFSSPARSKIEALEAQGYHLVRREGDEYHFVKMDSEVLGQQSETSDLP